MNALPRVEQHLALLGAIQELVVTSPAVECAGSLALTVVGVGEYHLRCCERPLAHKCVVACGRVDTTHKEGWRCCQQCVVELEMEVTHPYERTCDNGAVGLVETSIKTEHK